MTIADPEAIRFVNEQIRPLCEQTRALVVKLNSMETLWNSGLNSEFPNDATPVDDGRDAEGVSRLTGADINQVMSVLLAMMGQYNSEIVEKPCVRSLSVS